MEESSHGQAGLHVCPGLQSRAPNVRCIADVLWNVVVRRSPMLVNVKTCISVITSVHRSTTIESHILAAVHELRESDGRSAVRVRSQSVEDNLGVATADAPLAAARSHKIMLKSRASFQTPPTAAAPQSCPAKVTVRCHQNHYERMLDTQSHIDK